MSRRKLSVPMRYLIRAAVIFIVALVFILGSRPPKITINEHYIKISGMYGVELRVSDISRLELREVLPTIKSRTNGMDLFGIARRGIYNLEELGRTRMLSFSSGGPFILMHTGNEWIVINYKDANETEALYQQFSDVINKDQ